MNYDEHQLAAVLTECSACRRTQFSTDPHPVCVACRRELPRVKAGTVHYDIRIIWPDGQPSSYEAFSLPIELAIEKLEVLVDELRASVKAEEPEVGR